MLMPCENRSCVDPHGLACRSERRSQSTVLIGRVTCTHIWSLDLTTKCPHIREAQIVGKNDEDIWPPAVVVFWLHVFLAYGLEVFAR